MLERSGSNNFTLRGVAKGDRVYIVSIRDGLLLLGGRITVNNIMSREEAIRSTGEANLFDGAREWILGAKLGGTPLNLHRQISPELARELRFVTPKSGALKGLAFRNTQDLDPQTTRGIRELTRESADLMEEIITLTGKVETPSEVFTVTGELLKANRAGSS